MGRIRQFAPAALLLLAAAALCLGALDGLRREATPPMQAKSLPQRDELRQETVVETFSVAPVQRRCISADLQAGEEVVLSPGREGITEQTVSITYRNGRKVSRRILSSHTVSQPVDALILYGVDRSASVQTHPAEPTATDGILLTPQGEKLSYTRVLSCTATAYSCGGRIGTTAIGTTARVGAVAVDPNYIPYGTKMYIVSDDGAYIYGFATAEDCGNFRGYHVDLYFNTVDECWTFGRRTCTVYILS